VTPGNFLIDIIDDGLPLLADLGGPQPSDDARRLLLTIAQQETGLRARYQSSPATAPGPARGWWQFEQGGGVAGVLSHPRSQALAKAVCDTCSVVVQSAAVYRAIEGHDLLATCFARLLVWTDPHPLPTTATAGWDCYMRLWRPGVPHPDTWAGFWSIADRTVSGNPWHS